MSMYRSYQARGGRPGGLEGDSGGRLLRERVRNILLALLAVALVVSLVLGIPAMRYRSESRSAIVSRLQNDCNAAVSLANRNLSRTGGTSSAATLGQIRGYVYAMDTVNQLYNGMMGGDSYLVPIELITPLYGTLENFTNLLTTGADTSVMSNDLLLQLAALSDAVNALQ